MEKGKYKQHPSKNDKLVQNQGIKAKNTAGVKYFAGICEILVDWLTHDSYKTKITALISITSIITM